jgi:glycosyltransferase involved in cell wall biosynthesis
MAKGLVPMVVDYGGPGELVTDETGYRIPLGTRADIVAAMRQRLQAVCANPAPLDVLSANARDRIMTLFTWQAKAAQVNEVYSWVKRQRRHKPAFFGKDFVV